MTVNSDKSSSGMDINELISGANLLILEIIKRSIENNDAIALKELGVDSATTLNLLKMDEKEEMAISKMGGLIIDFNINNQAFNLAHKYVSSLQ